MEFGILDVSTFVLFLAVVVGISLYQSRKEEGSEDYFLAGRNLAWWLVGFSLIASNISTEHFVGMAGEGYGDTGLAIASYEWIAAITLVFVGLVLLPMYLRLGIYTMPEFLERRYGERPRTIMAVYMLVAYVVVAMAAVLFAGAIGLSVIFGLDLVLGIWLIGLLAGAYTIYGGLKAVVWSDLLQGAALLLGGAAVAWLSFEQVGGIDAFLESSSSKLHMILPADHPSLPWTALLFGIWIPNLFYWGFNQFITQRSLASRSLADGQMGIVLAAFLKLLIPFIIVFPGIIAYQLYSDQIGSGDEAYAVLIQNVLPAGLRGILFAALFGAVMSSLDSMLNSASTIFTMDIYRRHLRPEADSRQLMKVGRVTTGALVIAACLVAPLPARFEGVFQYIQMIWGFISPAIVAVFIFGMVNRRAPELAATVALVLGIPIYGVLLWKLPGVAFLNHMAITFTALIAVMLAISFARPLPEPVRLESTNRIELVPSRHAKWLGAVVIVLTVALYVVFW